MIFKNIDFREITDYQNRDYKILSVLNDKIKKNCKVLEGDFFLDSFNYFPLTFDNNSFKNIFSWGDKSKYDHFYSKKFNDDFNFKKKDFQNIKNVFVLGTSASDNYYRNIITFLPRVFFIKSKRINIAIHRNSSNRFRVLVSEILKKLNIEIKKYVYLDNEFYKFSESQIPQFFNEALGIKILNKLLSSNKEEKKDLKIYISRQNSIYRNLINESDLVGKLREQGFRIIDTKNMPIIEQINYFSSARVIISPTSSVLSNLIFCKKGTEVIEIAPIYKTKHENLFRDRYLRISKVLNLNHNFLVADSVENNKIDINIDKLKFISKKFLYESNYYKDLLVKKNEFEKIISKF